MKTARVPSRKFRSWLAFVIIGVLFVTIGPRTQAQQSVTLTLGSWRTEDIEPVNKINAQFSKMHPNIKIVFEPTKNTEYDQRLQVALSGGKGPDIMYLRPFFTAKTLYKSGFLLPLNGKVTGLEKFPALARAAWTADDGKTEYGLPAAAVAHALMYNKKIFQKNGLGEPQTWDEFLAVLKTLKGKGVIPLAQGAKDLWTLSSLLYFNLGPNFYGGETARQKLMKGEMKFTTPGFVQAFQKMLDLKPYFPEGFQAISYVDTQQLFLQERAAIFAAGSWEIQFFQRENPGLDIGIFPPPPEKKGDRIWICNTVDFAFGINAKTPHPAEALTYLNWLATTDYGNLLANELVGFFPYTPGSIEAKNPLVKEWTSWFGPESKNTTLRLMVEKLSDQEPTGWGLLEQAMFRLLGGEFNPQQAAAHVENGLEKWYPALKK